MYKHGKPVYKLTRRPLLVILIIIGLILAGGYIKFIKPASKNTITGSTQARVTTIKNTGPADTKVDEKLFSLTLPGAWKLSAQDWDARYHSYQWNSQDQKSAGRWFRVYVDTIPSDQAVNYLLPITIQEGTMAMGQVSDNCVNFTKGAIPEDQRPTTVSISQSTIPSRWELVDFLCDNASVSHQVVGASTSAGINTVILSGPTQGQHKYFFMFDDNNISPDFGMFERILGSFTPK